MTSTWGAMVVFAFSATEESLARDAAEWLRRAAASLPIPDLAVQQMKGRFMQWSLVDLDSWVIGRPSRSAVNARALAFRDETRWFKANIEGIVKLDGARLRALRAWLSHERSVVRLLVP